MSAVLDLGCGRNKTPGAVGIDRIAGPGVDVVHDLDSFPYPIMDNSFERVIVRHSLEHLADPEKVLEELHRVCVPGARIVISTPHFTSLNAYADINHRHRFSLFSFDAYCGLRKTYGDSPARFKLISRRLAFWKLHDKLPLIPCRLIGIEALANHCPNLYERFCAFVFPAMEMHVILEVVKE